MDPTSREEGRGLPSPFLKNNKLLLTLAQISYLKCCFKSI